MTNTIDWGTLMASSGADFEILPVGKYAARVTKAEAKQSKNGKLMFAVTFTIISGPKTNRTINNNIVLSPENPRAVQAFFINLRSLGVTEAFLKQSPAPAPETVAAKLVGAQAMISVTHREYQGQQRDNVDRIDRLTGSAAASVPTGVQVPTAAPAVKAPALIVNKPVVVASPQPQASGPTIDNTTTQESTVPIPEPENPAPSEAPAKLAPTPVTGNTTDAAPNAVPAAPQIPDFANISF